jgi:hypothetical protein
MQPEVRRYGHCILGFRCSNERENRSYVGRECGRPNQSRVWLLLQLIRRHPGFFWG